MTGFCGSKCLLLWATAFMLLAGLSCSRSIDVPSDETSVQAEQSPFREDESKLESAASQSPSAGPANYPVGNGVPFHDPDTVPVGTLLTVRLSAPITTQTGGLLGSFEARLEEPIVVAGNVLIPRGAPVAGRVEWADSASPDRGYLRLGIESIQAAGSELPIQTASLFVRQKIRTNPSAQRIQLERGRALTFRLSAPMFGTEQRARRVH